MSADAPKGVPETTEQHDALMALRREMSVRARMERVDLEARHRMAVIVYMLASIGVCALGVVCLLVTRWLRLGP